MSKVKRYWFYCSWDGGSGEEEEAEDGGYVSYEDYEKLLNKFQEQNKIIQEYRNFVKDLK